MKWLKTENGDDTTFEHITSVTAHKRLKNVQQVLGKEYHKKYHDKICQQSSIALIGLLNARINKLTFEIQANLKQRNNE